MTEEKQKKEASQKTLKPTKTVKVNSENIVYIGQKPVMNYVVACLTFLNSGAKKVIIKARGQAISRAVDTTELLRRSFAKDLRLNGISLSTEEVTRSEGQKSKVSAIEITVTKP
ncbi:DNA-binding protein Alba [Candidatus Bathyarchaeota archaeon]|nr:DNA-binding protein Alba [Candidatus Bathyarchaeota archaeon]